MMQQQPYIRAFPTHSAAEDAARSLMKSGFDVRKLSIVGQGPHAEEHAGGIHRVGDRIRSWAGTGAFWGGLWGMLLAPAVLMLPGLGLVAMAGPTVAVLFFVLEGVVLLGGLSALGVGLIHLGGPRSQGLKHGSASKADQYLLVVHGDGIEKARARSLLNPAEAIISRANAPDASAPGAAQRLPQ